MAGSACYRPLLDRIKNPTYPMITRGRDPWVERKETKMSTWEEIMWADLEALPETEQIVVSGEWITRMTQSILPELGRVRRLKVLKVLNGEGMDATRLAEIIGSRRTTITRLAEEGRAIRREDNINEAAISTART